MNSKGEFSSHSPRGSEAVSPAVHTTLGRRVQAGLVRGSRLALSTQPSVHVLRGEGMFMSLQCPPVGIVETAPSMERAGTS